MGVAAAEAVATIAIAAVVLAWDVFGSNFSREELGSYKITQIFHCNSCPTTISSPLRVKSPTIG